MQQTYERLIELLGKPSPKSGDLFARLIEDLRQKPVVDCTHHRIWFYDFPGLGIELFFDAENGIFWKFTLSIATAEVRAGKRKPYVGNFPYGIVQDNSIEEVESKFPGGTMVLKDYRSDLDLRPLEVTFHFQTWDHDLPDGGAQHLIMVTAKFMSIALQGLAQ